jgi:universal stress protein E
VAQGTISRVVVGTDFSRSSEAMRSRVVRLPLEARASVLLAHVAPEGLPVKLAAQVAGSAKLALEREVEALQQALTACGQGEVSVAGELLHGKPERALGAVCKSERAQYLILGRRGQRTLRDQVLGSTVERVIRTSQVPVLVVAGKTRGSYAHPLIALDLEEASKRALELSLQLLGPSAPKVHLIHAYEHSYEMVMRHYQAPVDELRSYRQQSKEQARAKAKDMLSHFGPPGERGRFELHLSAEDPRRAILHVAEVLRADLIGLGTSARRGVGHFLMGSVAEGVLRRASCDVLVTQQRT